MNLRGTLIFIFFISLISCQDKYQSIYGEWEYSDKYYNSKIRIEKINGEIVGAVLDYDDGTTVYRFDKGNRFFLFKKLKKKHNKFIDGTTGASKLKSHFEIEVISSDSLAFKTLNYDNEEIEIWTRVKKQSDGKI